MRNNETSISQILMPPILIANDAGEEIGDIDFLRGAQGRTQEDMPWRSRQHWGEWTVAGSAVSEVDLDFLPLIPSTASENGDAEDLEGVFLETPVPRLSKRKLSLTASVEVLPGRNRTMLDDLGFVD